MQPFRINTAKPYSASYKACCDEAKVELRNNARPEIKGYVDDISCYDTIFVCYPNWWGTVPMCILTFLEHYDLTGKKIVPLCTNEGSGMGNSERELKKYCNGAVFVPGLSVRGHKVQSKNKEITEWVEGIHTL